MKYCIATVSPAIKVDGGYGQSLETIMRSQMCWFQHGKFYVYPDGDFEQGQLFDVDELRKPVEL